MNSPWLHVARQLIGQKELEGPSDNPLIIEMFRLVENSWAIHDEEPWCAAFVGACLELSGYRSTRSLTARSYEKLGKPALAPGREGCIVVLWREPKDSGKGHVGFLVREEKDFVVLLGGNQGDRIHEQSYPIERVLAYRWPTEPLPAPTYSPLIRNITQLATADGMALTVAGRTETVAPDFDSEARGLLTEVEDPAATLPATDSGAPAARVLARPMAGADVRDLQEKLKTLEYPVGTVDGEFGPMTEAAVFEFQSDNGLPANGIADSQTLAALVGGSGPRLAPARIRITEAELLEKGSRILADAKSGEWVSVAAGVLGLFGFGDAILRNAGTAADIAQGATVDPVSATAAANSAPATAATTATTVAEAGNTLLSGVADHLHQLVGVQGGVWAGLLAAGVMAWRYFNMTAKARVSDHVSGVNRGQ